MRVLLSPGKMSEDFHRNSTIISYRQMTSTLVSANGSFVPRSAVEFRGTVRKVQVVKASITNRIANVWTNPVTQTPLGTMPAFDNATFRLTHDGGATWVTVVLPPGVYTVPMINAAITDATQAWNTLPTDPSIVLTYNLATHQAYLNLDSTKDANPLAVVGIDFSVSRINELLGFIGAVPFIGDGVYGATANAQLDWIGSNVSVLVQGLGPVSYVNTDTSQEICQIPLSTTGSIPASYQFPHDSSISPFITASIPTVITKIDFMFVGDRYDLVGGQKVFRPVWILDGEVNVTLRFTWGNE